MRKRSLLISLLLFGALFAQIPPQQQFVIGDTFTGSSGESFTLYLPANATATLVPDPTAGFWGSVSASSSICIYTGTAAVAGTRVAPISLPGTTALPVFVALTSSNGTGSGTCQTVGVGQFAFSGIYLYKAVATIQSVTVTITPATGTVSGYINAKVSQQ